METMILETPFRTTNIAHVMPKMRIAVHIDAEVLDSEIARRKANVWLLINAGNLLGARNPELVLKDELFWRYDVILTSPKVGTVGKIGQICVKAKSGEVMASDTFADELIKNANTPHSVEYHIQ